MLFVGIIAPKRDVQVIKNEINEKNIEIMQITKENIKNLKNIKFEEIIFLKNINLDEEEYKYMSEIISMTQYLIINADIEIDILQKIQIKKAIKLITFGFNSKSTITISSVNDEKIIVCIQRDIEKINSEILECQEKRIYNRNNKKIYNNLIVFIINELYDL